MAGIGFELRKMFREQGLMNSIKAYSYSSLTTVGPMILCMFLILALQRMMSLLSDSYLEWELYIATVTYCFVFSIVITSGISIVITRYVSDMTYEKKYDRILSSLYGAIAITTPIAAAATWLFVRTVSADAEYKIAAYLFFMELVVVWLQGVYMSALKDYMRIVREYVFGVAAALASGFLFFEYTELSPTAAAILGIDVGFLLIIVLSFHHFEQMFPKAHARYYFSFLSYFNKFKSLFFIGSFVYSGVYLHNFVYWFGPFGTEVAGRFMTMPYYDLPVYFAYISVLPTLVMFVVSVETSFYEKFRMYYLNILKGGTFRDIMTAKKNMQKTLIREIGFLMEVQLLFTILSIVIGLKFLPKIGFTMDQLDVFNILVLSYFLYIFLFVLVHVLMYFDDRKGLLMTGILFVVLNISLSYWTMMHHNDGLGMFIASFLSLAAVIARLLYVLRNIDYFTFCSQPLYTPVKKTKKSASASKAGAVVSVLLVLTLALTACTESGQGSNGGETGDGDKSSLVDDPVSSTAIMEDKQLYERDKDDSLDTLYVTILPDEANRDDPLTWYDLNRLPDKTDTGLLDVIVQEGEDNGEGPEPSLFGYGVDRANATITLRGQTAWNASQKSYRIKLFDEAGLWHDQRTINLNKHITDLSRVRNKLSFDLFETIPNMTSLRTQFVHLYVKDLSQGQKDSSYEDYGLYTQIEQSNKKFLKSHLLDPNGYLYKVTFFEFYRYPELLKSQNDPTYDKAAFETILEIKGREDHTKLLQMLDDVNNMQMPIDEVMEKHFDLDNLLTWTAASILTDNMDTGSNNLFLYSPLNSDKWYFLPWDYDGGWELQRELESIHPYQNGLSNYWNLVLFNRFFRSEEHVEQLEEKMEELTAYINRDSVKKLLDSYTDIVKPFLFRNPDVQFLPGLNTDYEKELQQLLDTPERSMQRFLEDIQTPKPFYQDEVIQQSGQLQFTWDLSFDLQDDPLVYDITVATDPAMTNVIASKEGITENHFEMNAPSAGRYYWKVIARDDQGHEQTSYDAYIDHEGQPYYGIRDFEVK